MLSETLSTLKMPLGPRVEFVLLCLQRHLGIVYGVVSLDSLDLVACISNEIWPGRCA